MTPFNQLKLLYEQLFNINDEITKHLDENWINDATIKGTHFQQIAEQIKLSKKGITLSETEEKEIEELDKKALEIITSTTKKLVGLKNEIQENLNKTKNTIKVNSAYTTQSPQSGQIIDEQD